MSYSFKGQQWVFNSWPFLFCISQISHILSYYDWRQDFLLLKYHKNYSRRVHIFILWWEVIPSNSTCLLKVLLHWPWDMYVVKLIPTPKAPFAKNNSELGCSQAEGIDNPFCTGHETVRTIYVVIISHTVHLSRIECKYCLICTSYLAGLFDVFILLHIWQNYVFWWLFTNEDTL